MSTNTQLQQYRQQVAHWKARAIAANYENKILRRILDQQFRVTGVQLMQQFANRSSLNFILPQHRAPKSKCKQKIATNLQSRNPQPSVFNVDAECHEQQSDNDDVSDEEEQSDDDDVEFELSADYRQFLEVNRKHKEDLAIQRARQHVERGSESDSEVTKRKEKPPTINAECQLREEQLKLLYGDSWRRIEGLETFVQMKYDQFCDSYRPDYWPNIPLKL